MAKTKRVKLSEFKKSPSSDVLVPKEYVAEIKVEDEENRILEFTISTNDVDRDGDTIAAAGWQLENYHKNPVVLWGHDHHTPAVGQSLASWVEGDALKSRNQYPTRDEYEFGNLIYRLHKGRYLRSVSVGFIPKKYVINEARGSSGWGPPIDFIEQELLEHSSCNVPANPEALQAAGAKGFDLAPMLRWHESAMDRRDELILDPETCEATWKILKGICGKGAVIQLPLLADTVGKIVGDALERGLPEVVDAPTEITASADDEPADDPEGETQPDAEPVVEPDVETPPADEASVEGDAPEETSAEPADPPADLEATPDPDVPAETSEVPPSEQDTDPGVAVDQDPDVEAVFEAVTERLESLARQVSKAGRVLSSVNENRLRRSRDLLDEVLSQLEEQEDDDKIQLTDDEGNVLLAIDEEQLSEITDAAKDIAATELRRASGALD